MTAKSPEDCRDMDEVRAGVDDVDRQIVTLIARRFGYMDAAARIKSDRASVRDEARKADVLNKVGATASEAEIDSEMLGALYEELIEQSIAYELRKFDEYKA